MKKLYDYKHIVWDWNGTLLNDFLHCVDCLNLLLARRNLPPCTPERYREIFDFPVINTYRELGFDVENPDVFQALCLEFMEAYERSRGDCHLHNGARRFIHRVHELGLTQSILSAYSHQRLAPVIREYDLNLYFCCLSGNDNDLATDKSYRGPAHLRQLGYAPAQVLYIGDTTHDVETARRMGVDCVIIDHGPLAQMSRERIDKTGVPVILRYEDLL